MTPIVPVLLAGGTGTRLWPVSRKSLPKQFVNLITDESMFTTALRRHNYLPDLEPWIIVTNEQYRFLAAQHSKVAEAPVSTIMLEPEMKNTAPAIAVAALQAIKDFGNARLLVQTADHYIQDIKEFAKSVDLAKKSNKPFVLFGVQPSRAETGYGYVETIDSEDVSTVSNFKEKPDYKTASEFIEAGNYLWNSGIFLIDAAAYLSALEKYEPNLLGHIKLSFEKSADDLDFKRLHSESFCKIEPVSIDYAIMEHLDSLIVVRHHGDWSDVGSWDGWGDLVVEDGLQNKTTGEVVLYDSTNNIINARSRLVVAVGLEDVVIVETSDAVLVSNKDHLQKIKGVVPTLEGLSYSQATKHPTDYRPWGHFDSLIIGDRYQVKKIVVNPGGKLSLQKHHHRAEHWIVVRGTAEVQVGDKTMILSENQSTYIPLGVDHRLSNPGKVPLTLIEIQTGSYLGEDDIVRLEDIYERL